MRGGSPLEIARESETGGSTLGVVMGYRVLFVKAFQYTVEVKLGRVIVAGN